MENVKIKEKAKVRRISQRTWYHTHKIFEKNKEIIAQNDDSPTPLCSVKDIQKFFYFQFLILLHF